MVDMSMTMMIVKLQRRCQEMNITIECEYCGCTEMGVEEDTDRIYCLNCGHYVMEV